MVMEPPYRWRDWANNVLGLTGDDLLRFINSETDALLPDGSEGQGLLPYLRSLRGEDNHRVAETSSPMLSAVCRTG
jgi:type I restriction enzyme M protein